MIMTAIRPLLLFEVYEVIGFWWAWLWKFYELMEVKLKKAILLALVLVDFMELFKIVT